MTEHEICKGCTWNDYPYCSGTKMDDSNFMNIENLHDEFKCGQKDMVEITDFTIVKQKTALELKVEELEARIIELEKI